MRWSSQGANRWCQGKLDLRRSPYRPADVITCSVQNRIASIINWAQTVNVLILFAFLTFSNLSATSLVILSEVKERSPRCCQQQHIICVATLYGRSYCSCTAPSLDCSLCPVSSTSSSASGPWCSRLVRSYQKVRRASDHSKIYHNSRGRSFRFIASRKTTRCGRDGDGAARDVTSTMT